jgi:hypothetical protein
MTAKKLYYNKLIFKSNNKTKTVWNIVKSITNNGDSSNIFSMNIEDKVSSNSLTIANAVNSYFSSVAENLLSKNFINKTNTNKDFLSYLQQNITQSFSKLKFENTTTYKIKKIIYSLKSKNTYGYEEISTKILKASTPYILSPLTYIFNKILQTGISLDRPKFSEVKPLYKKGDKSELSNYRPISLLPTFSKIIEKIIYKRLYLHLNNNNILVNQQFGFREKLSTEMAIYTFLSTILLSLDKKHYVGGLFCDLQKGFCLC